MVLLECFLSQDSLAHKDIFQLQCNATGYQGYLQQGLQQNACRFCR
jgi:hypothetical protein